MKKIKQMFKRKKYQKTAKAMLDMATDFWKECELRIWDECEQHKGSTL